MVSSTCSCLAFRNWWVCFESLWERCNVYWWRQQLSLPVRWRLLWRSLRNRQVQSSIFSQLGLICVSRVGQDAHLLLTTCVGIYLWRVTRDGILRSSATPFYRYRWVFVTAVSKRGQLHGFCKWLWVHLRQWLHGFTLWNRYVRRHVMPIRRIHYAYDKWNVLRYAYYLKTKISTGCDVMQINTRAHNQMVCFLKHFIAIVRYRWMRLRSMRQRRNLYRWRQCVHVRLYGRLQRNSLWNRCS